VFCLLGACSGGWGPDHVAAWLYVHSCRPARALAAAALLLLLLGAWCLVLGDCLLSVVLRCCKLQKLLRPSVFAGSWPAMLLRNDVAAAGPTRPISPLKTKIIARTDTDAEGKPKALPTRHWSGYIKVPIPADPTPANHTCYFGCQHNGKPSPAGAAFVHYWLVENAAKDPQAPTLVWQQGGPGGSSLIGLFTEVGPLTLNDASIQPDAATGARGRGLDTGVPRLFDNPFSWHHAPANMLFVEHPAPTGFSYCEPAEACTWDDDNQAKINYAFYVRFFAAYPELAKNEFYFSGESYAGVLVRKLPRPWLTLITRPCE
jgi:hypothetical protein